MIRYFANQTVMEIFRFHFNQPFSILLRWKLWLRRRVIFNPWNLTVSLSFLQLNQLNWRFSSSLSVLSNFYRHRSALVQVHQEKLSEGWDVTTQVHICLANPTHFTDKLFTFSLQCYSFLGTCTDYFHHKVAS